jgi:hypothetical protein
MDASEDEVRVRRSAAHADGGVPANAPARCGKRLSCEQRSMPTCARKAGAPAQRPIQLAIAISAAGSTRAISGRSRLNIWPRRATACGCASSGSCGPPERENHWLETMVMAVALAEHLGLSSYDDSDWARLEKIGAPLSGRGSSFGRQRLPKAGAEGQGGPWRRMSAMKRPTTPDAVVEALRGRPRL